METVDNFIVRKKLDIDTDTIIKNIFDLKPLWVPRSDEYPFYTLGRNAYLDGKTDSYKQYPIFENPLFYNNFEDLYEAVIDVLKKELCEEVKLAWDLSYPGFHIFKSDKKLLDISGHWHHDSPHTILEIDDIDTSTFTVPIMLPKSGGGIDYLINEKEHYLPYREKQLLWHNGKTVHRIAKFKECEPDEYRITLQGHLVRRNGQMEVFW